MRCCLKALAFLLLLTVVGSTASPVYGQSIRPLWEGPASLTLSSLPRPTTTHNPSTFLPNDDTGDHTLEGALIGAAIGAAGFFALGSALCDADSGADCSSSKIEAAFLGAAIGGFIGLWVGKSIEKKPPP